MTYGHCYCDLWDKDPAHFERQGIPRGYCGICERCGRPGHTRHYPGPVPYTGSWCNRCYRIIPWTNPALWIPRIFMILIALVLAWIIWKIFARIYA